MEFYKSVGSLYLAHGNIAPDMPVKGTIEVGTCTSRHNLPAKARSFSLLLRFRLHPSRFGRFCKNPFTSSNIFTVLKITFLLVSAFHVHTSLSACNGDMPSTHSPVQTEEQRHCLFSALLNCHSVALIPRYFPSAQHRDSLWIVSSWHSWVSASGCLQHGQREVRKWKASATL